MSDNKELYSQYLVKKRGTSNIQIIHYRNYFKESGEIL